MDTDAPSRGSSASAQAGPAGPGPEAAECRAGDVRLLAVALHEEGDDSGALDAAVRARETSESNLPLVQEAILYEHAQGDIDLAMQRWAEVAERAGRTGDLADLMQQLRARVRLERAGYLSDDEPAD